MAQRKLFYALNSEGQKFYIDRLNTLNKNQLFLCPFCKKEVIAHMGNQMIWHFTHKDKACEHLSGDGVGEHKNLFSFSDETTTKIDFKMDSKNYQCPVCKVTRPKDAGVKFREDMYLCKECYHSLDSKELMKL